MNVATGRSRPLGARIGRAVLAVPDALFVERAKVNGARDIDDFYSVPTPLPAGRPGDLIKAEPSTAYLEPLRRLRHPARTWRVMYLSTAADGRPMAVTGTLLLPHKPFRSGRRPLISYACGGYVTMAPRSAPSVQMKRGAPSELHLVATFLMRGWAVMITDYQRFGGAAVLTFGVSDAAGHAVIDGARAAQRLGDAGLDAAGPVAFAGYSLGGHASAAAVERHPGYAPELNVVGAALGGGPSDLQVTTRRVEHGPLFACVLFAMAALKASYPELPTDGFNERGLAALAEAPHLPIEAGVIRYGFRSVREFTGGTIDEFFDSQPQWVRRVEEQKLGLRTPTAPILLYHGRFDPFNPLGEAHRLCRDWRARGADVTFATYPVEHLGALVLALPAVHRFLGRQFATAAQRPTHLVQEEKCEA